MQIILLEDIVTLGFKDEIVDVKPGYARNYLIPQKLAVIATESAKKVLAENLRQRAHKLEQIKNEAEALGAKVSEVKDLVIAVKTSNKGVVYGSVSNIQVAEALAAKGVEVDRKKILVKDNIKEIGEFVCQARLHKDVTVDIPFTVVSENFAEEIAAAKAKAEEEARAYKEAEKARKAAAAQPEGEEAEATEEAKTEEAPIEEAKAE